MSKKRPLPTVVLNTVFVRDHQRRLRLVIDLLEEEINLKRTPNIQPPPTVVESPHVLTATQNNSGGKK